MDYTELTKAHFGISIEFNGVVVGFDRQSNFFFSMMSSSTLPRQQARRQGSVKQQRGKKDSSSLMSPEQSYEPQGFVNGNTLAMSHPNLEDLMKQPPSYEAAIARTMQSSTGQQPSLENQYFNHNRQVSMPASVASNYSNHLSPPQSNLSHVQSPPHR